MKNVHNIIEHAESHCKVHGTRLTEKRKLVLAGLLESDTALSAYELIAVCKEKFGENIPAMSIYRILDFLENERLVHKLNLANKYVACAHISCNHAHEVPQFLICRKCSKVKEISISKSTISELNETVKHANYHLLSPQLELNCLCENCMLTAA